MSVSDKAVTHSDLMYKRVLVFNLRNVALHLERDKQSAATICLLRLAAEELAGDDGRVDAVLAANLSDEKWPTI